MALTRRGFLKALGIGGAGAAATTAANLAGLTLPKFKLAEAAISKKGVAVRLADCGPLERIILEAIERKTKAWPEGHLVHTIRDIDVVRLKSDEVLFNCVAGDDDHGHEAFTVMVKGVDPNQPKGRIVVEQQAYDLMTQIDRWARSGGSSIWGTPGRPWDEIRQNRKELSQMDRRRNYFTFRNLKKKVDSMNRRIRRTKTEV